MLSPPTQDEVWLVPQALAAVGKGYQVGMQRKAEKPRP